MDDNIRMNIKEIGWEFMDRVQMAQERIHLLASLNMAMNFYVP
jgi:hypothetical protein